MARAVTGADFQNHEPPATLASAQGNRPLLLQCQEAMQRQQVPDGSVGDKAEALVVAVGVVAAVVRA